MTLLSFARRVMASRPPDFVIGGKEHDVAYLNRWYVIPRNQWFNIYAHEFLRSDDDRALHDHPWFNLSILLEGSYYEETIRKGGIHVKTLRWPGWNGFKFRSPWTAHRVELLPDAYGRERPAYTLFLTGPKLRRWGFHCPKGWRDWELFADRTDGSSNTVGGCGELS